MGASASLEDKDRIEGYKFFAQWQLPDVKAAWSRLQQVPGRRKAVVDSVTRHNELEKAGGGKAGGSEDGIASLKSFKVGTAGARKSRSRNGKRPRSRGRPTSRPGSRKRPSSRSSRPRSRPGSRRSRGNRSRAGSAASSSSAATAQPPLTAADFGFSTAVPSPTAKAKAPLEPHEYVETMRLNKYEFLEVFTDVTARLADGETLALPLAMFDIFGVLDKVRCGRPRRRRRRASAESTSSVVTVAGLQHPKNRRRSLVDQRVAAAKRRRQSLLDTNLASHGGDGTRKKRTSIENNAEHLAAIAAFRQANGEGSGVEEGGGERKPSVSMEGAETKPGTVPGLQVMLMLALLCDCQNQDDQMRFCFSLFDLDGSGLIDIDELITFFETLTEAAFHVRILPVMPAARAYEKIAEDAFRVADADGSGSIDCDEFIKWAKTNVISMGLLTTFKAAAPDLLVDKRKLKQLRARAKPVVQATSFPQLDKKKRLEAHSEMIKVATAVMDRVQTDTLLDVRALRKLRRRFVRVSTMGTDGVLSSEQFANVMKVTFPTIADEDAEALFHAFDTDGSGSLDFDEFTLGLCRHVTGNTDEKLQLLFDVYDKNGDNSISVGEMLSFVTKAHGDYLEAAQFTEDLLQAMGQECDGGNIPKEKFMSALRKQPVLLEAFGKTVVPGMDALQHDFKGLGNSVQGLDLQSLSDLWGKYTSQGETGARVMSLLQFRRFMVNEFHLSNEALPLANRLFNVLDVHDKNRVTFKDLMQGLGQVMAGSIESKAAFYFSLYDMDGSGEIDREELLRTLYESQVATQGSEEEVVRLMQRLDVDGSGTVDAKEFLEACKADHAVLECFGRIFGQTTDGRDREGEKKRQMLKQARSRFNMIRRMLSAHPSDVLSPKEQINLGQYGKINKVQTGLRELRRLSVNTASDIMTKLQRIDTRTTMRKLDATLAQHSRHIASHEATPFAAKLSSSSLRQHGGAMKSATSTASLLSHASKVSLYDDGDLSTVDTGDSASDVDSPLPRRRSRRRHTPSPLRSQPKGRVSARGDVSADDATDGGSGDRTHDGATVEDPGVAGGFIASQVTTHGRSRSRVAGDTHGALGTRTVSFAMDTGAATGPTAAVDDGDVGSVASSLSALSDTLVPAWERRGVGAHDIKVQLAKMRKQFHEERVKQQAARRHQPSKLYRPLASSHAAKDYGRAMRGTIDSLKRRIRHELRGFDRAGDAVRESAAHGPAADAALAALHATTSEVMTEGFLRHNRGAHRPGMMPRDSSGRGTRAKRRKEGQSRRQFYANLAAVASVAPADEAATAATAATAGSARASRRAGTHPAASARSGRLLPLSPITSSSVRGRGFSPSRADGGASTRTLGADTSPSPLGRGSTRAGLLSPVSRQNSGHGVQGGGGESDGASPATSPGDSRRSKAAVGANTSHGSSTRRSLRKRTGFASLSDLSVASSSARASKAKDTSGKAKPLASLFGRRRRAQKQQSLKASARYRW